MVYVLNAGHEVLLFAVTGFVIVLVSCIIALLCRCCGKCRRRRSRQHLPPPDDLIADGPDAPLIPAGRGYPPSYPGRFYGTGGDHGGYQQQNLVYPTGEYYNSGQNPGPFAPPYPLPPGQHPSMTMGCFEGQQNMGMVMPPNVPVYGEPPPPYDSVRESQAHRFYPGQVMDPNYAQPQQQQPQQESHRKE